MAKKSTSQTDQDPISTSAAIAELPDGPADEHGLTTRQLKILQAIKSAMIANGYPPSMREIGAAAGLASPASVQYQLQALEKKGFIRRDPSRGRAMEVLLPGEHSEIENAPLARAYFSDLVLALQGTQLFGETALCLLPKASGPETVGEVADLLIRCEGVSRVLCGGAIEDDLYVSV